MFCPKCGTQNSDEARFCAGCGYNLSAEPAAPQAPVQPDVQEAPAKEKVKIGAAIKSALTDLMNVCKTLFDKAKKLVLNNKLMSVLIGGSVLLVLLVCIVAGIFTSGDSFIRPEYDISLTSVNDMIVLVRDNKVIQTNIEGEVDSYIVSMDGTVVVFQTEDDELYVAKGKKITKIADDVDGYQVNPEITGVLYSTDEDETTLYLYNVSKKRKTVVLSDADTLYQAALSPNGKCVVYTVLEDGESKVMYFEGGDTIRIASGSYRGIALTDKGKQIYVVGLGEEEGLYCFDTKGNKDKILSNVSSVFFNSDYTQALIFSEGRTYISTKGKEAEKISGSEIRPLMVPNVYSSVYEHQNAYPIEDLYDIVYTGRDSNGNRSAWFIDKNTNKSSKLASKITGITYDESCEYLYYIDEDNNLRCLEISDGNRASDKSRILANEVDGFVVTSDRDLVYYESDGVLYSANGKNGKSKRTICTDDLQDAVLSKDDVLFYIADNDLYATSNGKRGKLIMTDVDNIARGINCVYVGNNDDDVYVSTGSKKLKLLLTLD